MAGEMNTEAAAMRVCIENALEQMVIVKNIATCQPKHHISNQHVFNETACQPMIYYLAEYSHDD